MEKHYLTENPDLMAEWDWEANKGLDPSKVNMGSHKKVWWKCQKCGYKWTSMVNKHKGCYQCKKSALLAKKNLAVLYPEIAKEWHPSKNKKITPNDVTYANNKSYWWKCSKCGYEWQARVGNRTILNRGCPCCSDSIIITGKNDLRTTHPEIAKEWHPTKNGTLTPEKVSYGYGKKVWWICPQGHEYQATVNHRTGKMGTNCPMCYSGRQTSFAEQAFYYYIKQIYPDAINRYKADFLGKMELDIYIPSIFVAIEYDGEAWHRENKINREKKKYELCKKQNIVLIRLKETPGNYIDIADSCYCFPELYKEENLDDIIPRILKKIDITIYNFHKTNTPIIKSYDVNIKRDRIKILQQYNTTQKNSFATVYPDLAKEWHPTKNGTLKPEMFKPRSSHKVWWKCPICGYEYQSSIGCRSDGHGCLKCGIEKATQAKRKIVYMIDPISNKIIKKFISISEASRQMKINNSNISMVCKGIRPKAGGYIWRYEEDLDKEQQTYFDFIE